MNETKISNSFGQNSLDQEALDHFGLKVLTNSVLRLILLVDYWSPITYTLFYT